MIEAPVLARYDNGGTRVRIHADGTKVREVIEEDSPPVLPEQMDLKITDWCDAGCPWCHEKSTKRGRHADLEAVIELLEPLPAGVEIAIGGGDPLSHPQFEALVRALAARGLICNVTVNGRHLERHLPLLKRLTSDQVVRGVGVSFHDRLPDWSYPHLVTHLITGVHHPRVLDGSRDRKILLLGYKTFGRGQKLYDLRQEQVDSLIRAWYRELPVIAQSHHLSFDNLAIEQLAPKRLFSNPDRYRERFMGEEGAYSMYIDAVAQTCALASYAPERYPWTNLKDMFGRIRVAGGHEPAPRQEPPPHRRHRQ